MAPADDKIDVTILKLWLCGSLLHPPNQCWPFCCLLQVTRAGLEFQCRLRYKLIRQCKGRTVMFNIIGIEYNKSKRMSSENKTPCKKHMQSNILLVDEDLASHHSSATTALWSGGFDVQLFAEVCVETKNVTSRVNRVTCHVLFANKRERIFLLPVCIHKVVDVQHIVVYPHCIPITTSR